MIHASIPWVPKTKDRPRHGKFGHTYTPTATKKSEAAIIDELASRLLLPYEPTEEPLSIALYFGETHTWLDIDVVAEHTEKQIGGRDLDNLGKLWLDAMDKVVFKNDKQVVDLRLVKM